VSFVQRENGLQVVQIRVCHAKRGISALEVPRQKRAMLLAPQVDMETLYQRPLNVQVHALQEDTAIQVPLRPNAQVYVNQVGMVTVEATTATVMVAALLANTVKRVLLTALFAQQDTINPTLPRALATLVVQADTAKK
jgi:hypothetical protein